jgi:hypothetical protein
VEEFIGLSVALGGEMVEQVDRSRREHATPRCAEEPPPAPMEIAPGHEVSRFLYS